MENRPMLERDEAVLKQFIEWTDGEALPAELRKLYWQYRATGCKGPVDAMRPLHDETLLHIVMLWKMGGHVSKWMEVHMPARPFRLTAETLAFEDKIEVWFRKAWREALFHGIKANGEVSYVLTDAKWAGQVRSVSFDQCREYSRIEDEEIPESLAIEPEDLEVPA